MKFNVFAFYEVRGNHDFKHGLFAGLAFDSSQQYSRVVVAKDSYMGYSICQKDSSFLFRL
jgi:hypothetical protein